MARIVAFSVTSRDMGVEALERLEGVAQDTALVFKNNAGKVTVQQASDLTDGSRTLRGGLLGAAVTIFVGPLAGLAAAGGSAGAAFGALLDAGMSDDVMTLAGKQLEAGGAAVFVLAEDGIANAIESAVSRAGLDNIEVGGFPEEAEAVLRETLQVP